MAAMSLQGASVGPGVASDLLGVAIASGVLCGIAALLYLWVSQRRRHHSGSGYKEIGDGGGTGVIKFWGPHENGDPGSPFSLVKWGPLWENGDPHTIFVLRCIKYSQLSVGWFLFVK